MTTVHLKAIAQSYGAIRALDHIDLTIGSGELFSLLGPSGCGKTTLLRIIAGFIQPTSGQLLFDDDDMTSVPPHKRNIGMVFQDYALFPDRSVFDNVAFGLKTRNTAKSELVDRVSEVLKRMGLSPLADRAPSALSGGQRQRVAMARALVISPRILLLDEPLSALDAKLRIELREAIRDIQQEFRITTLFVTHDQDEALSISDRVALMNKGRIEQFGSPIEMYDHPKTAFAADFLGEANLLPVLRRSVTRSGFGRFTLADQEFEAPFASSAEWCGATTRDWKLCVRPQAWAAQPRTSDVAPNSLKGEVCRSDFSGPHVSYLVQITPDIYVKTIEQRQHGRLPFPVGTPVSLQLPATAVLLAGTEA